MLLLITIVRVTIIRENTKETKTEETLGGLSHFYH